MKTILQITLASFLGVASLNANAQTTANLEVFSENGEKFFLTLNGVKINNEPQTNVKATQLSGEFHRALIEFTDATLGNVSQNIMLTPGTEQRAVVKLGKKGYVLRPFGEPVAISAASLPATKAVQAETVHAPQVADMELHEAQVRTSPAITQTTTVTTTTVSTPAETYPESVTMDVGIGEAAMNIQVRVNDGTGSTAASVKTTETITTTTTAVSEPVRKQAAVAERTPKPATEPVRSAPVCGPMASADFAAAKKTIASQSFEESKITTANQVLRANCMSTDQIKEVMGLFSFEDSKIDFAKTAYEKCSDKGNYWKLNDAFTFESSIDDLNSHIENR